jgi:carbon-monoxide dehydrogenase large subunit
MPWSSDIGTAQLLSASLIDYAMPRADSLPLFRTEISEVPSTTNPLGMRGGSEGGITPGLAVVANAILDAFAPLGVEHIDMPATPERVWRDTKRPGNRAIGRAHRDLSKNGSLGGERRSPSTGDGGIWDMKEQRADDRGHYT